MIQVDLTLTELFKSFDIIESGDIHIDLHNSFDCYDMRYSKKEKQFSIKFRANQYNNSKINDVDLIFEGAVLEIIDFKTDINLNPWTVSIMYRGRFDAGNETLAEITPDGKCYYYLDFYDDYSFELWAKSVTAFLK